MTLSITTSDYRKIAEIIDAKSDGLTTADTCRMVIEYDTDRFYSNLELSLLAYEADRKWEINLLIISAKLRTYLPQGECANDFDRRKLIRETTNK